MSLQFYFRNTQPHRTVKPKILDIFEVYTAIDFIVLNGLTSDFLFQRNGSQEDSIHSESSLCQLNQGTFVKTVYCSSTDRDIFANKILLHAKVVSPNKQV